MPDSLDSSRDRSFLVFNAVVSVTALSFLAWLLLLHGGVDTQGINLRFMPAVNASLNAISAGLLVAGYIAIRGGHRELHQRLVMSAFVASALFLAGYVAYHYVHGDTRYVGAYRTFYLSLLASHVVLSIGVLPMAISAVYLARNERFVAHKRVARVLLPIWLYVSVTGVVVYFFLHG
ncbi:MAG: DUF420 domain-containing protein [Polyangiaceae bacterium]|nr:DUF420 domain-containing protein [Polyangiaceae bacterium]